MERSVRWLALAIGALAVAVVAAAVILVLGSHPPASPPPAASLEARCNEPSPVGHFGYRVEQDSMLPTLEPNDMMLIESGRSVSHGDIVVFEPGDSIEGAVPFIKRVIGVAGDTVEIRDGSVFLNGARLDEPYTLGPTRAAEEGQRWLVPRGAIFVVGDNRNNSTDSRSAAIGFVPLGSVLGRAVYRCAPLTRRGPLP